MGWVLLVVTTIVDCLFVLNGFFLSSPSSSSFFFFVWWGRGDGGQALWGGGGGAFFFSRAEKNRKHSVRYACEHPRADMQPITHSAAPPKRFWQRTLCYQGLRFWSNISP